MLGLLPSLPGSAHESVWAACCLLLLGQPWGGVLGSGGCLTLAHWLEGVVTGGLGEGTGPSLTPPALPQPQLPGPQPASCLPAPCAPRSPSPLTLSPRGAALTRLPTPLVLAFLELP